MLRNWVLKVPCYNTYMINIAQFVEIVHSVDDSIRLIDELLAEGLDESKAMVEVKPKSRQGSRSSRSTKRPFDT